MKSKKTLAAILVTVCLLVSVQASAALNAYLFLKGKTLGQIKGSVTQKGREDKIMVIAADHSVKIDAGKKQHGTFKITKDVDKSSPLLYKAFATGEVMSDFELQFWAPQIKAATGVGSEVQMYTVRLKGAKVAGIDLKMQNNKNPDLMRYEITEDVSFSYDEITWIWVDGNVTATDTTGSNK